MQNLESIHKKETVFTYDADGLKKIIGQIIKQQTNNDGFQWLRNKVVLINEGNMSQLDLAFAAIPRKMGRHTIKIDDKLRKELHQHRQNLLVEGWSMDRLCRIWLLLHIDANDKLKYIRTIERFFLAAEMTEQSALYSALPILAYPEHWQKKCAEGIRSNIGIVLESIMCNNPYPAQRLEQAAWNQMVLKAFFTEKPIHQIIGLDERTNKELAQILSDYAHERWAAHRPVNPMLWRVVASFVDEEIFPDIERLASSENELERKAAVLVCRQSSYPPARGLLNVHPALSSLNEVVEIGWDDFILK